MSASAATPVSFSHLKYGQMLAIDASVFPRWTGIVPDREPHVLDFHEFLVISRGDAMVEMGGQCSRVSGPAVLFTPANLVRRVEIIDPMQLQLVVFSPRAFGRSGWSPALRGLAPGAAAVNDQDALASLNAIAALMTSEVAKPQADSGLMLDALLTQFVVTLNRAQGIASPTPALVMRFERLLDRRAHGDHGVAAYASSLGVSADHLSAVVRTHRGISAKAMIERRLFADASRLLTTTALSIAEIASALGFAEPSHFTRFFTRASGEPPSRFRRGR